jgi:hypothetical protein
MGIYHILKKSRSLQPNGGNGVTWDRIEHTVNMLPDRSYCISILHF